MVGKVASQTIFHSTQWNLIVKRPKAATNRTRAGIVMAGLVNLAALVIAFPSAAAIVCFDTQYQEESGRLVPIPSPLFSSPFINAMSDMPGPERREGGEPDGRDLLRLRAPGRHGTWSRTGGTGQVGEREEGVQMGNEEVALFPVGPANDAVEDYDKLFNSGRPPFYSIKAACIFEVSSHLLPSPSSFGLCLCSVFLAVRAVQTTMTNRARHRAS